MRTIPRLQLKRMNKKDRYQYIIDYFKEEMPKVTTELEFGSVFQLLVAVVLSAQCTDKRVNSITPQLFERYPDAKSMAEAEADEVYEYIKSVSYPNAKSQHLVSMARMLISDFNGEVPDTMDKLIKLPGVGRKTANVIQAVAFGRSVIAVDTHVFRVSHRLGLVTRKANTPLKVESELMAVKPFPIVIFSYIFKKIEYYFCLHNTYRPLNKTTKFNK